MASVAIPRPALPPLHATLSRTERHHLAEWYIAWALIVFAVPLIGAGAIVAHATYHVGANVHTYGSAIYLPPELNGYAERGSGTAGLALAALWIVIAGTVIHSERRRLFPASER